MEHTGWRGTIVQPDPARLQSGARLRQLLEVPAGGSLQTPEFHPPSLQWCEKHKRSGRQTLGDLLIKPHQRITKYPLLLQAVLKRSPEPQAQEALNAMVGTQVGSRALVWRGKTPSPEVPEGLAPHIALAD